DGVAVRKDQSVEAQPEFTLPFHFSRALRFQQLAAKIRTNRDHDAIVLGDWKGRLQVNRVSRLGAARGNAVLKHHAYSRSRRNRDSFARAGLGRRSRRWRDRSRSAGL